MWTRSKTSSRGRAQRHSRRRHWHTRRRRVLPNQTVTSVAQKFFGSEGPSSLSKIRRQKRSRLKAARHLWPMRLFWSLATLFLRQYSLTRARRVLPRKL